MAEEFTNLAATVEATATVLAPISEFVLIASGDDAGKPAAHKTRMGTSFTGLNGTFGTITSASWKKLGNRKDIKGGSPGTLRGIAWMEQGNGVELEVSWDRGHPGLRQGSRVKTWVEEEGALSLVNCYVTEISIDLKDEDTATAKLTLEHRKNFDTQTGMWLCTVDGAGRVISAELQDTPMVGAQGSSPDSALPTSYES
jgi:hypothetical protein